MMFVAFIFSWCFSSVRFFSLLAEDYEAKITRFFFSRSFNFFVAIKAVCLCESGKFPLRSPSK